MEKVYLLQGLSCAHCAGKIEEAAGTLDGVSAASVNFVASTLKVEVGEVYEGAIGAAVERMVRQHEPDIVVTDRSARAPAAHDHGGQGIRGRVTALVVGGLLLAAGILLGRLYEPSLYMKLALFLTAYLILGGGVVLRALKNIARGRIFDENFLMSVATIGAFAIGEYSEAVAVMLFYQIGEFFQEAAVHRSKRSIADLMNIRPDYANVKTDAGLERVAPEGVRVGDVIVIKPGEKVPLDGVVIEGESALDTAALTGESVPRVVRPGDPALSGCVNQGGVLTLEVTKTFGDSTAAKIIDLVENAAGRKSQTEHFITTFSRYYTPFVVGAAVLLALLPPLLLGGGWVQWVNRALIFLVISCPCALVISIPLGFFGGIGGASRKGVLIKGGNYLEALSRLDIVVFDKTGTLTRGLFEVVDIRPVGGYTRDELLACAAHAEAYSSHPIARSITAAHQGPIDRDALEDYHEIPGQGVRCVVGDRMVLAGSRALMLQNGVACPEEAGDGTKVYVAADGAYVGCIIISDEVREDSARAIAGLKARGVRKTVMLTGDHVQAAQAVARALNIDEVHAGLLPGQKVEQIERLAGQTRAKGKVAFVGDGINDAPVLARADVGVAMGGLGSDAAIEAADVVLMTDEPSKLLDAIDVARFTKRVVWQNIAFALGIKGGFLLLGAFGIATMWEAVFADVGVAVLAILNAMRVLRRA